MNPVDDPPYTAASPLLRLHRLSGPEESIDRDTFPFTLGRHPDCDVLLEESAASRHHARIELRCQMPWIVDLGSTNGIQVHGVRVMELPLREGDMVRLGGARFRVEGGLPAAGRASLFDWLGALGVEVLAWLRRARRRRQAHISAERDALLRLGCLVLGSGAMLAHDAVARARRSEERLADGGVVAERLHALRLVLLGREVVELGSVRELNAETRAAWRVARRARLRSRRARIGRVTLRRAWVDFVGRLAPQPRDEWWKS